MESLSSEGLRSRPRRRRLQLRLPLPLLEAVERCAERSGMPAGAFVRLLLEDVMADEPRSAAQALRRRASGDEQLPAIAALIAAEHARLVIEAIFPSRAYDWVATRGEAVDSAEERLEELRRRFEQALANE